MSNFLSRIQNNKHFKYGLPFFLFVFGGKFLLEEFRSVRYDKHLNPRSNKNFIKPEDFERELQEKTGGKIVRKEISPEEELAKLENKWDGEWNTWENKRGPRPWEEGSQQERVEKPDQRKPPSMKDIRANPASVKEILGEQ